MAPYIWKLQYLLVEEPQYAPGLGSRQSGSTPAYVQDASIDQQQKAQGLTPRFLPLKNRFSLSTATHILQALYLHTKIYQEVLPHRGKMW